jgi:hypothetical protein
MLSPIAQSPVVQMRRQLLNVVQILPNYPGAALFGQAVVAKPAAALFAPTTIDPRVLLTTGYNPAPVSHSSTGASVEVNVFHDSQPDFDSDLDVDDNSAKEDDNHNEVDHVEVSDQNETDSGNNNHRAHASLSSGNNRSAPELVASASQVEEAKPVDNGTADEPIQPFPTYPEYVSAHARQSLHGQQPPAHLLLAVVVANPATDAESEEHEPAHNGQSAIHEPASNEQFEDGYQADDDEDPAHQASSSDSDHNDPDYEPPSRQRVARARKQRQATVTVPRVHTRSPSSDLSSAPPTPEATDDSGINDPDMITPPTTIISLPRVSGGVANPPARAANTSSPIGPQSREARRDGERLATDLHQLQVRSPPLSQWIMTNLPQVRSPPLQPGQSTSTSQSANNGVPTQSPPAMPLDIPRRQESTNSSSTEGSVNHPYPPSSLSDYTPEGYPKSMMPNANANTDGQQADPLTIAAAQAEVSAADAAIMAMNGTSFVHSASTLQYGANDPLALPGGYANFTHPNNRFNAGQPRPAPSHPSRQFSTSTTSASTSSEEEDLCIPEAVRPNAWEMQAAPQSTLPYVNYVPSAIQHKAPWTVPKPVNGSRGSLPSTNNGYTADPATLPLGATAHSPRGTSNSIPVGIANNESSEDDDDDGETVGDRDSRSRSTSSEVREPPVVSKGKRKAPSATPASSAHGNNVPSGKASAAPRASAKPDSHSNKKRRRSEISDSQIDPSLHAETDEVKMEVEDGETSDGSDVEDAFNSGDSEYDGPGPVKSKVKPRRSIAGRSRPIAPKATTKKTKSAKSSSRPSDSGITRCDYVSPLPVSRLISSSQVQADDLALHQMHHDFYA